MSTDDTLARLLAYHGLIYRLGNGWTLRFRIRQSGASAGRPHGIKYAFTLHDIDGTRLLGFDNAHGLARTQAYDHLHRFRNPAELVPYAFQGHDELICDFFDAVKAACRREGVLFDIVDEELGEDDHEENQG